MGVVLLASCGLGGGTAKKTPVTSAPATNFPTIPVTATLATTPTTTAPGGAGTSPGPSGDAPGTYTVRPNDTWYGLAKQFGVDVQVLLDAQDPPATLKSFLGVGQKIVYPDASATPTTPGGTSTGGSTDTSGTSGGSTTAKSTSTTSNVKAVGTYTVVAQDYWIGIAKKLGVPLADLLAVNNATGDTRLDPGKIIKVPAKRKA